MNHPTEPQYPSRPWRHAGAALLALAPAALLAGALLELGGHTTATAITILVALAAMAGALACGNRAANIDSNHLTGEYED